MGRRIIVTCGVLFACICAPADAQLVYSADGRLYEIDADGSERSLFTQPTDPRMGDSQPEWSPDGTQLAVVHERNPNDVSNWSRIDVLSPDGSQRRKLMRFERSSFLSSPSWSPEGDELAFARFFQHGDEFTSSIVIRDLSSGAERTLVSQPLDRHLSSVATPEWSPDGTAILYTASELDRRSYFQSSIHIAPVEGGATELLAPDAHSPAFSPDGSRIAFISIGDRNGETCGSDECSYNGELYVMDADGSDRRRLTRNKGDDLAPDWGQDGSRIAFNSDRNFPGYGVNELYSIEPDGDCLTWLTNGTANSVAPAWRPTTVATDPGACGATPRRPLIETDLTPLRTFSAARPLWLGRTYRGLLLSDVDRGGSLLSLGYYDCAHYRAAECPPSIELLEHSVCSRFSNVAYLRGDADRRRRALVQHSHRQDVLTVSGGVSAQIFAGRALTAFRALRPFPRETDVDQLRAPRLPAWLMRQVERAARLHERLGSVAAVVERTGLPRRTVRERLATAKTLDDFGHRVRTTRC